jgi:hypothetical protein
MLSFADNTEWEHDNQRVRVIGRNVSRGYVLVAWVAGKPGEEWPHEWLNTRYMGEGMYWRPVGQREAANGTR